MTGRLGAAVFLAWVVAAWPIAVRAQDGAGWRSLRVDGVGLLPVRTSRDWAVPQPGVVRAVITVHGKNRDADVYDEIARRGLAEAGADGVGTLLLTPRFADTTDPEVLPAGTLRWAGGDWMDGGGSATPSAVGSFEAMDAMLARLSDRALFPNLKTIVLAGHSAGGQFVQRYAMIGRGPDAVPAGIAIRFVVANPSSYAYLGEQRPVAVGGCSGVDRWKYGLEGLPSYAGGMAPSAIARRYVHRDVTYLLGELDDDPSLAALDRSCAAEAQGATHLQRGLDFFRSLQTRYAEGLDQRLRVIPGVGHQAGAMLTSAAALAAIYR